MPDGIIICGLNGAGKSTLAKALAEQLNYRFIDMEDVYFPAGSPEYRYSNPRSSEEAESVLLHLISESGNFVLASVTGSFREAIVSHFRCVIHVKTPKELRIKRVYERSYRTFGERMCKGGDLYEKEQAFFDFVRSRDEIPVNDWLSTVSCPILETDGTLPTADQVKRITEKLRGMGWTVEPECSPQQSRGAY